MTVVLLALSTAMADNVLVIVADDLGTDKVSSYAQDYATAVTPSYVPSTVAIDDLAASGLRFQRAWASPTCTPTRASLQTGLHAFRHGLGDALGDDAVGLDPAAFDMLAAAFTADGYATAHFGKWHLGSQNELGRTPNQLRTGVPSVYVLPHPGLAGYDVFEGTLDGVIGDYEDWSALLFDVAPAPGAPAGAHAVSTAQVATHATTETAAAALGWIAGQAGPWMATVAFHAPHAAEEGWTYGDADPACVRSAELACLATESCDDEARAVYQALAECLDLHVEGLLASLDPAVLDDTLIVFLGDNGTPAAVQEGEWAADADGDGVGDRGKGTVYENGVRVPFVVADGATVRTGAPGRIASPGLAVAAGIHVLDLYETLRADVLGDPSGSPDARSFADCFDATDAVCGRSRRFDYAERFKHTQSGTLLLGRAAVRYGNDKLVLEYDADAQCLEGTYYETSSDPFETTPLAWTGTRAGRLQDHFQSLHVGTGSWADGLAICP